MEERRGYICSECRYWINPQDIGDGTGWTTDCEKGVLVSGISVPCVSSELFFTSYHSHPTVPVKRVKRVKPGRLFSFNQKGDALMWIIISLFAMFTILGAVSMITRDNEQYLNNSVVISKADLDEIMYQLSENQKQIMRLQISNAENFRKIELLERALLASSLFSIMKEEREWQKESNDSKERKQPEE